MVYKLLLLKIAELSLFVVRIDCARLTIGARVGDSDAFTIRHADCAVPAPRWEQSNAFSPSSYRIISSFRALPIFGARERDLIIPSIG